MFHQVTIKPQCLCTHPSELQDILLCLRLDFLTQFDTQKFQTIEKNPIKEFTEVKILKVHSPKGI